MSAAVLELGSYYFVVDDLESDIYEYIIIFMQTSQLSKSRVIPSVASCYSCTAESQIFLKTIKSKCISPLTIREDS